MNHGSLFSGIGGFDLAAEWMQWNNIFHCEWNDFGKQVLKYYWPNAISYNDITKTDFIIHREKIDILTGGFPCQPYSTAGKRLGKEDERHLWPEMLRAIREIRPRWIVGENVFGLVNWNDGLVFHEVQIDLEAEGYEVQPFILPACAVNAPHRRDRVWFVAHNTNSSPKKPPRNMGRKNRKGVQQTKQKRVFQKENDQHNGFGKVSYKKRFTTDAGRTKLQRSKHERGIEEKREVERKSRQFSGSIRSQWQEFPTQSPICDGNDGISDRLDGITFSKWRNESIKAGGNAIVPQVALQIFKAIFVR
jgi:DNA (cytosine-5)-methyltransferase 1